jgi:hypothetical protein
MGKLEGHQASFKKGYFLEMNQHHCRLQRGAIRTLGWEGLKKYEFDHILGRKGAAKPVTLSVSRGT